MAGKQKYTVSYRSVQNSSMSVLVDVVAKNKSEARRKAQRKINLIPRVPALADWNCDYCEPIG